MLRSLLLANLRQNLLQVADLSLNTLDRTARD
jgi:hypothetical protein